MTQDFNVLKFLSLGQTPQGRKIKGPDKGQGPKRSQVQNRPHGPRIAKLITPKLPTILLLSMY